MLQNISATLMLLCMNACHAYPVVKFALEMAHLCSWLRFSLLTGLVSLCVAL